MLTEQALLELFAEQHNWQDRYRQLIMLSRQLPDFPIEQKREENEMKGCENKLWLISQKATDQTFIFLGDSEGRIVKGLLAVLLILTNGKTKEQILKMDFPELLKKLNLMEELSNSRQLGILELISRIKQICSLD